MLQPKKSILDKSKLKTEKNFITNSNLSNDQTEKINNELLFNSNWYSNRKQVFDNTGKSQSINTNSFIPSTSPKIELNNVYGELGSYAPKEDLIELNKKFQNRERGTVVHEDDHRRRRYSSMNDKINLINTPIRNSMTTEHANTFSTRNEKSQDVQYEYDPSEIHANIQNLRFYNNLKPNQYIDEETMKNIKIQEKQYLLEKFNSEEIRGMLNSTVYNDNSKNNIHFAAQGGYINQNTNMNRYAQGGDLTQFNTGGTHEQSPIGGVPIGNNNSVEQGETKQNNFVYSNRIFLDSNIVSQYNLPKSLIGKSVADATKMIDDKFKGRNDKISQSTKNGMLSKIAEAQEAMKPQEPEIEQSQMALGGFAGSTIGQGFGAEATGAQQSQAIGAGLGIATTALDLGNVAFGKPAQNTDGLAASTEVDKVGMIGGSAIKGATAGMAFGPAGAGIGALIGAGAGLLGTKKAEKAAVENTNNFALNTNRKYSDQYAFGGIVDPTKKITTDTLLNTPIVTGVKPSSQSDRFRYAVGEQGGVQNGTSGEQGHYLYYDKKPGQPGFNPSLHREFVNQGGYDTYMKSPQGQQYRRNLSTQSLQPIEQLANGGKMNQYVRGGVLPKPPTADYDTNVIKNLHDVIGITPDMPGYGTAWGDKSNTALFNYDIKNKDEDAIKMQKLGSNKWSNQKKDFYGNTYSSMKDQMGLTPEGYKFTPETPVFPQKEDPTITPTQTKAGFEAYANAKQIADAKQNKSLAGKGLSYANDNLGNLARYAPIAANALQLAQLKKPQGERLDRLSNRYKPEYVDEASLQNIANNTMNNTVNAIGQSGASQGQLRSSLVGSQLERTKAVSDAYGNAAAQNRATNDGAQQFNLGVDQVNLQQSNTEKDINARDQAAYRNAKREYITGIGEGIGNVGNEQAYKKIAITTTGYNWLAEYQKANPTTTPEQAAEAAKKAGIIADDSKTAKKNALGGYLIKNRVK